MLTYYQHSSYINGGGPIIVVHRTAPPRNISGWRGCTKQELEGLPPYRGTIRYFNPTNKQELFAR